MERWMLDGATQAHLAQLRSQLANLTAASELLERRLEDPRGRDCLAAINQGICRMLRLIGRLELAHRLTGEDEIRLGLTWVEFPAWWEGLCRRLQGVLRGAGIELSFQPMGPCVGLADPKLLEQMVMELVSNAAQAGGPVTLTAVPTGRSVRFSISDQGPGLAPEELSHLFDREPSVQGGLGIPLAQHIAQLHGGLLMADSAQGKGLTMVAVIPLRDQVPPRGLATPEGNWGSDGFDSALVGLSHLLPPQSFTPETLG